MTQPDDREHSLTEHSTAWQRGYDRAGESCPNPACRAKHDGRKADLAEHYRAEAEQADRESIQGDA